MRAISDLAASEATASPTNWANTFFTETIVGRPVSLKLGRSDARAQSLGVDYTPRVGTRLARFWQHDLENNAWRYAIEFGSPVQSRAGQLRLFLERHALRIAYVASGVLVLAPVLVLVAFWRTGMLEALLMHWGLH
jgi:hypothetical protein